MSKKSTQSQVSLEANRFHVDKLQLFPFQFVWVFFIVEPELVLWILFPLVPKT
jgi:hypothetical protein